MLNLPKRFIRGKQIKPPTPGGGGPSWVNYGLAGLGAGGLLYLVFKGNRWDYTSRASNLMS